MSNKLFGIDLSKSAESQFEKQPDFDLQNNISDENSLSSDKVKSGKVQPAYSTTEVLDDNFVKKQNIRKDIEKSDRELVDDNIIPTKSSLDSFNF